MCFPNEAVRLTFLVEEPLSSSRTCSASDELSSEIGRADEYSQNQSHRWKQSSAGQGVESKVPRRQPITNDGEEHHRCFSSLECLLCYLLACKIEEKCSEDTIPYKVVSGEGTDKYPVICFNNQL